MPSCDTLSFDPASIRIPNGHFIAGRLETGGPGLPVIRPSDGQVIAELPVADAATVDRAVTDAAAAQAQSGWGACAPRERARVLRRFADLIEADGCALGQLEALSSTRPITDAMAYDVPATAEAFRFFAEYADKLGGEVAATRSDHLGLVVSEPYGVVAAITPWNFPLSMVSWKAGAALAAGNAVVVKPSELTPFSTLRLAEIAVEAGLPPGLLTVIQGDGRTTGDALCRHPRVGKISFTGSTLTGAAIMAASAASGVKPVTLELGGKSPQLVFADVPDLAKTAGDVAGSILYNAGQVCVAGSRLIVEEPVADAMLDALVACFSAVRPGPTWEAGTGFAPIVSRRQLDRIDDIVRRTIAAGATVLCGGGPMPGRNAGAWYAPTILTNVTPDMPAAREEIFGPVLTVQTFSGEEQGIALADHPDYGLAAGVHTGDIGKAMRAMRRIQAGTVWINRYGRTADFVVPTGGFKRSGIGKDLGRQAVEANLRHKSVLIAF
ncbi:aldehyde dehydrogenase family protein [Methylobacterium nonmethylotrophicum]|uniref:Aldehyde dehydrogenase family protein n=1 Tax=Methylobacterium nonmethylotrophicum TaxID=1141884 RepID=A0A4Z0NIA5_9HYPH|nr:aldehyde dehydrogenase family protein [Methylobacterium nonmethylotrophicum]TGD95837.1 aldehyde dehydrogenase family protein [Methylobacterium nonmethylotrophicum]